MNYLLVHVAICDMLFGIFLSPRGLFYGLYEHPSGLLGDLLCKFVTFGQLGWICGAASIFTLVTIAWERYKAIVKPFSPRFSNKNVKRAVIISWILAFIIGLPEIIATAYNPQIKGCDYLWMGRWDALFDATIWLIAVSSVPPFIMIVLYGKVIHTLWGSGNRIEVVSQRSIVRSRKRVTKSVILVTVILFICWTPLLLNFFVSSYSPVNSSIMITVQGVQPVVFHTAWVLILLNAAINPFIYAFQDIRFRNCMTKILFGEGRNTGNIGN